MRYLYILLLIMFFGGCSLYRDTTSTEEYTEEISQEEVKTARNIIKRKTKTDEDSIVKSDSVVYLGNKTVYYNFSKVSSKKEDTDEETNTEEDTRSVSNDSKNSSTFFHKISKDKFMTSFPAMFLTSLIIILFLRYVVYNIIKTIIKRWKQRLP